MYMARRKTRSRRRRRNRRRRTNRRRSQKGGNLWRNFFKEPAFPPGGPYQVGCANLKQGRYYDKLCNTCLPNPKSSVGDMYPGYKSRMKGGRRRKTRRRTRRTRRVRRKKRRTRRRRRRRRRVQRGGQVGEAPKPLPTKQIMQWMQNQVNNFLPSQLVNAGRAAGLDGANLQHKYYGERTEIGGNVMQQPIGNMKSNLSSLSKLGDGEGFDDSDPEEEVNEGKLPGKTKTQKESDLAQANSKINDQLR